MQRQDGGDSSASPISDIEKRRQLMEVDDEESEDYAAGQ